MITEASWSDALIDAVKRSLAPGEILVAHAQCYTEIWRQRVEKSGRARDVFFGFDWEHAALTNANVRFIRFKQQKVKTGWLSFRVELLPEIESAQVIPISNIVAAQVREYTPQRLPSRHLNRFFKCDVGPVLELRMTTAAGEFTTSSPYLQFQALVRTLHGTITGASLAAQSTSVADAVAKLAELRESGLISDDEFQRAKSGFIGTSIELAESSAALIRQLAQLRDAGVLTEAEFRIKKWDLLSRPG